MPFKLHGHVLILGSGSTAFQCSQNAIRCGADKVTIVCK